MNAQDHVAACGRPAHLAVEFELCCPSYFFLFQNFRLGQFVKLHKVLVCSSTIFLNVNIWHYPRVITETGTWTWVQCFSISSRGFCTLSWKGPLLPRTSCCTRLSYLVDVWSPWPATPEQDNWSVSLLLPSVWVCWLQKMQNYRGEIGPLLMNIKVLMMMMQALVIW